MLVMLKSIFTLLCLFKSKWLTCKTGETGSERETGETRHNNSPPTKRLRLRLGWGRDGVEVEVGFG